jgi:hypothetical protein
MPLHKYQYQPIGLLIGDVIDNICFSIKIYELLRTIYMQNNVKVILGISYGFPVMWLDWLLYR